MSAKPKGLGRGFDSLIPTQVLDESFDPTASQDEQISELRRISVTEITPNPHQPRRHFDEEALAELADSIKEHGMLQPIVVSPMDSGYQIVAGERRWRAAILIKLERIPAIVRTLGDQHKLELALIENLQRKDLNPLETATAYLKLHQQFNLTYEEIGQRVGGRAVSTVSNIMRLLNLPETAKTALIKGQITEGHARQILALDNPKVQADLLEKIIKEDWSVRKAEQYVIGYKQGKNSPIKAAEKIQTETIHTKEISKKLEAEVKLKSMAQGGQLMIRYKDDDDLDRITNMLLT